MKLVLFLATLALAHPLVFEACSPSNSCFQIITPDARSWTWMADYNGSRFIRVYLQSGLLDIPAKNLSVRLKR